MPDPLRELIRTLEARLAEAESKIEALQAEASTHVHDYRTSRGTFKTSYARPI